MQPICQRVNGAALYCITTDRFKSEYFSLRFLLPMTAETVQQNSLLSVLLKRGSAKYPSKLLLNRRLDELYSTTISSDYKRFGDMQEIRFSADFLGDRFVGGKGILRDVLQMMAEIIYRPLLINGVFKSEYAESEKRHLRDGIRSAINDPRGYALTKCRRLLCRGEPYALSLIGEEDTVDAITPETLAARYADWLGYTPVFFYVGHTPPADVAKAVADIFPVYRGGEAAYTSLVKCWEGETAVAEEEMPFCQGKLSLGFRTDITHGHRLAPAMMMLNEVFGASPASKLFLNVREKRSLCYSCSSLMNLGKGLLFVNAGMKPENRGVTEEAVLGELHAIAKGEISDTELDAAHRSLAHSCRQMYDHPASLSTFYSHRALMGDTETIESFARGIADVCKADIVEAADRLAHGATFFLKGTLQGEEGEE